MTIVPTRLRETHAGRIFRFTQPHGKEFAQLGKYPHVSYLEEDIKDVRVGAGEEDDGEEGADASVEHGGADLGQRLLYALISAPCDQNGIKYSKLIFNKI